MAENNEDTGFEPTLSSLEIEEVLAHMTFREACKKFLHCEDGFSCFSYSRHHHSKYVYLIKWKGWDVQSWEEEYFLIDKLNAYKKEHGLPGKLEIDTFDVQDFLKDAVTRGDPDVSEKVALFVKNHWVQPE